VNQPVKDSPICVERAEHRRKEAGIAGLIVAIDPMDHEVGSLDEPSSSAVNEQWDLGQPRKRSKPRPTRPPLLYQRLEHTFVLGFVGHHQAHLLVALSTQSLEHLLKPQQEFLERSLERIGRRDCLRSTNNNEKAVPVVPSEGAKEPRIHWA
jgi:hypothetical protein